MFWDLQPLKEIHIHQTSNIKQNGDLLTPKTQCPPNIVWNLTHFCHGVLSWPPWESDCRHPRLGRHHEYTDSTFVDTRLVRHFSRVLISFLKKSGSFRGFFLAFSGHFREFSPGFPAFQARSRRGPGAWSSSLRAATMRGDQLWWPRVPMGVLWDPFRVNWWETWVRDLI
jgi:hypothetical protein